MLTTLADVPLPRRARGVRELIMATRPAVDERLELLSIAIWPSVGRYSITAGPGPLDRAEARARAAELRAAGWSYAAIARELGVPTPTVKDWGRRGRVPGA